jgi:hypothetical protein
MCYSPIGIGFFFILRAQLVLAKNTRFHTFFPVYSKPFTDTRDGPCLQYFMQKEAGAEVCHDLLNCMLENTSDVIKGDMASGIVALGLMPTLLIFLSSSTAETTLLARRRPLLALLLAAGSPAVQPPPIFSFPDPTEMLQIKDDHLLPRQISPWQAVLTSVFQYTVALAAITNVYLAAFHTGYWTVNTISCDSFFYQMLWAGSTLAIYFTGIWALALRVNEVEDRMQKYHNTWSKILQWFKHETTPCVTQDKIKLVRKSETYLFVAVSSWASILTTVHVLWGTIAFSSVHFLGKYYCQDLCTIC